MCWMWYVSYYRKKIITYSHRVCSLYIPKYLSNGILNVNDIIISIDGFKAMLFTHIYCNTYYVNIEFTTKFTVETVIVHLYFCNIFFLLDLQHFSFFTQDKHY